MSEWLDNHARNHSYRVYVQSGDNCRRKVEEQTVARKLPLRDARKLEAQLNKWIDRHYRRRSHIPGWLRLASSWNRIMAFVKMDGCKCGRGCVRDEQMKLL